MKEKSTFGYVFSLGTRPISWKSKLQHAVVQSSVEIEYYTMNEATRRANWYKYILKEMGFSCEKPLTIFSIIKVVLKLPRIMFFMQE